MVSLDRPDCDFYREVNEMGSWFDLVLVGILVGSIAFGLHEGLLRQGFRRPHPGPHASRAGQPEALPHSQVKVTSWERNTR